MWIPIDVSSIIESVEIAMRLRGCVTFRKTCKCLDNPIAIVERIFSNIGNTHPASVISIISEFITSTLAVFQLVVLFVPVVLIPHVDAWISFTYFELYHW